MGSHPRAENKISFQGIALLQSGAFRGDLIIPLKNEKDKENNLEEVIKKRCSRRRMDEEKMWICL